MNRNTILQLLSAPLKGLLKQETECKSSSLSALEQRFLQFISLERLIVCQWNFIDIEETNQLSLKVYGSLLIKA